MRRHSHKRDREAVDAFGVEASVCDWRDVKRPGTAVRQLNRKIENGLNHETCGASRRLSTYSHFDVRQGVKNNGRI